VRGDLECGTFVVFSWWREVLWLSWKLKC